MIDIAFSLFRDPNQNASQQNIGAVTSTTPEVGASGKIEKNFSE
jgi:hypothetical protein